MPYSVTIQILDIRFEDDEQGNPLEPHINRNNVTFGVFLGSHCFNTLPLAGWKDGT